MNTYLVFVVFRSMGMCMVWVGMAMQILTLQPPPGPARLGPILMNQVDILSVAKLLYYSKDPSVRLSIRNGLGESWTPWLLFEKTANIFVEDYLYQ